MPRDPAARADLLDAAQTILTHAAGTNAAEFRTMRNRVVHDYESVDPDKVWAVIERDIPELISLIEPLLPPPSPNPGN